MRMTELVHLSYDETVEILSSLETCHEHNTYSVLDSVIKIENSPPIPSNTFSAKDPEHMACQTSQLMEPAQQCSSELKMHCNLGQSDNNVGDIVVESESTSSLSLEEKLLSNLQRNAQQISFLNHDDLLRERNVSINGRRVKLYNYSRDLLKMVKKVTKYRIRTPIGLSAYTVYAKLSKAMNNNDFDPSDFQKRIDANAKTNLPRVTKRWLNRGHHSLDGFAALRSRDIQDAYLRSLGRQDVE